MYRQRSAKFIFGNLMMIALVAVPLSAQAMQNDANEPRAKPIGNIGQYLGKNYPREALKVGGEGRVALVLDVDSSGKVTNCAIETSSGFPELDDATCKRARKVRFRPAKDADGHPISSKYPVAMTWSINS